MTLKRARPLDEAIEIAGEDYDYDDVGGRDERIERRKKRRSRRKKRRSKRLKKDSDRLRREAKVTSSRSSSRRKKRRSSRKRSTQRKRSEARPNRAAEPQQYEESFVPYDDYEVYDEGYDDPVVYDDYEEAWPDEDYDPEEFEDPYDDYLEDEYDDEFEGEFAGKSKKKGLFARRKARAKGRRKNWEKPAMVGKLRIQAKKGHRAAIRELESGLYLVAEVAPGQMDNLKKLKDAQLAGDGDPELGALALIAKLASLRARRALNKQAPQPVPAPVTTAMVAPSMPSTEPAHPWYDKAKVPPGVGGAVVTQPGDTMWGIASKHLGSGLKWNQIYLVNASQLQGKKASDPLSAGMVLWLPVAPTGNWMSA